MGNDVDFEQKVTDTQFNVKIGSVFMSFELMNGVLQIKGYTSDNNTSKTLKYDASYEDLSLPQDILNEFNSVHNFFKFLCNQRNQLTFYKDDLAFKIHPKSKETLGLPLKLNINEQNLEGTLQKTNRHPIRFLPNPNIYPYNAVVRVFARNGDKTISISGSGVLIDKTTVLTVAHNVYRRPDFLQAKQVLIYVQTNGGQVKINVKKHLFPNEYRTTNLTDMHKYDFAYLKLEKNTIIKDIQILERKWNVDSNDTIFEVVGYSSKLDEINNKVNGCYNLKCDKFIQLLQNYATYPEKAAPGISGGPLIVQQGGKFKVIGLHQCLKSNMSQAVLLTDVGKNPKQILDQLDKQEQNGENVKIQVKSKEVQDKNLKIKIRGDELYSMGEEEFKLNNFSEALKLFKRCLQARKEYPGYNTIEYADTLHQISRVHGYQKNYDQELVCCEQSLKIKQITVGKNHEKYTKTLRNIGLTYSDKGDNDKALKYLNEVRKIYESTQNGRNDKNYALALDSIGLVHRDNKQYQQALKCYKVSQNAYENSIGKDHFGYANILNHIGVAYKCSSSDKEALKCFCQSVQIMIKTKNQNHPYFKTIKNNLQETKVRLEKSK